MHGQVERVLATDALEDESQKGNSEPTFSVCKIAYIYIYKPVHTKNTKRLLNSQVRVKC